MDPIRTPIAARLDIVRPSCNNYSQVYFHVSHRARLNYLSMSQHRASRQVRNFSKVQTLPPILLRASIIVTSKEFSSNTVAQRRPDMPAPIIHTRGAIVWLSKVDLGQVRNRVAFVKQRRTYSKVMGY